LADVETGGIYKNSGYANTTDDATTFAEIKLKVDGKSGMPVRYRGIHFDGSNTNDAWI
jgi:hypothetical protein